MDFARRRRKTDSMEPSFELEPSLYVLPSLLDVPLIGLLAINAFLVTGEEPYLVDTGMLPDGAEFVRAVEALIDPAELRWIYLTHADVDHVGAIAALVDRAPHAKVITTFVGVAKLQIGLRPVPRERILLCNPGEEVELGDRILSVMRPPLVDAPETTMVYDSRLDALFSADLFGAPLVERAHLANDIAADELARMQLLWATLDAPWVHDLHPPRLAERLANLATLDPAWVLSAHLPPARRLTNEMCDTLARAPEEAPFVAPDQTAFAALLHAPPSPPPPSHASE